MGRTWYELADKYIFFNGKENENHELGTGFFVHKRLILAVKRAEFSFCDGASYTKRPLV
jgi:hypothetical protein